MSAGSMGRRILVVRFSAIGDCVMAAWPVTAIRVAEPDAFILWAVEGRCAPVVDRHRLVSQRVEFPRDKWKANRWSPATWREQVIKYVRMREHRFDLGFDLHGHSKTALCLRLACPKRRIAAAATDGFGSMLNPVLGGRPEGSHEVDWGMKVINALGDFPPVESPILPEVTGQTEPDLVTITTGAGHPSKIYPIDRWRQIAEALVAKGKRIVLLGGKSDPSFDGPGIENLVGRIRLKDTLAYVAKSGLHVAADTGTGHMAAAMGVPVISLFGPTDPARYRPYSKKAVVLRVGDQVTDITVPQVLEVID